MTETRTQCPGLGEFRSGSLSIFFSRKKTFSLLLAGDWLWKSRGEIGGNIGDRGDWRLSETSMRGLT